MSYDSQSDPEVQAGLTTMIESGRAALDAAAPIVEAIKSRPSILIAAGLATALAGGALWYASTQSTSHSRR